MLTEEQYQQFLNGDLYVNAHRQTYKPGKFRRQLRLWSTKGITGGKNMVRDRNITRRAVLWNGIKFSIGGATLIGLGACGESDDRQVVCNAQGQLSNSDQSMRNTLGYADVSPNPQQVCGGCMYFTSQESGEDCGSCVLLPGQVNSGGRCNSWSAMS